MIEGMLAADSPPVRWIEKFIADRERGMAAAILLLALQDWRWPTVRAEQRVGGRGFDSLEEDVLKFWHSPWGVNLREWFGLEGLDIAQIPAGGGKSE